MTNSNIQPFIVITTQRSMSTFLMQFLKKNINGRFQYFSEIGQDIRIWKTIADCNVQVIKNKHGVPRLINYDENILFEKMINNDYVKIMYNQFTNLDKFKDFNKKIKVIHLIRNPDDIAISKIKAEYTNVYHYYEKTKYYKNEEEYIKAISNIKLDGIQNISNRIKAEQEKFKTFLDENNFDYLEVNAEDLKTQYFADKICKFLNMEIIYDMKYIDTVFPKL